MVQYKLFYFNGRGVGEIIRQVFALSGQEFEDIRYTIDDWPKHKAEMPFGQMPVLEEDGKQLPQSFTIARYLARKFGFAGKNPWDEANVDALIDQWYDFHHEIEKYIVVALGFGPEDLNALEKEVFAPAVKKHFPLYVAALNKSGSGFLVGNSVTYVDLPVAEFVANVEKETPHLLKEYPELLAHKKKVHDIPEIKKWRQTRPESSF